jgi:hypothetical protein
MSQPTSPHSLARSSRPRHAALAIDADVMRKRADMRTALAVDAQAAKDEHAARQRAVSAKTARLAALRLARDAG